VFKAFWLKFNNIGEPWLSLGVFLKEIGIIMRDGCGKSMAFQIEMFSDNALLEYQRTGRICHTMSFVFQIFHQFQREKKLDVARKFSEELERRIILHPEV